MGIQPYDPENRQGELGHVIVDAYEGETLPGPSTRICLAFGQPPSRSIDWSLLRKVLPRVPSRKTSCLIVIRVCLSPLRLHRGLSVYLRVEDDVLRSTLPRGVRRVHPPYRRYGLLL